MSACPLCSKVKATQVIPGVSRCDSCGAVYGQCYLGDSYGIVKPFFSKSEIPADEARYYDLDCLGSKGIERRHGWFDPKTGFIAQVG